MTSVVVGTETQNMTAAHHTCASQPAPATGEKKKEENPKGGAGEPDESRGWGVVTFGYTAEKET